MSAFTRPDWPTTYQQAKQDPYAEPQPSPTTRSVYIRRGKVGDEEQLANLTHAIADAEGNPAACQVLPYQLREAVLEEGWASCLVACQPENYTKIMGAIIYYPGYASYKGARAFFLENVAVAAHARGKGVATALFAALSREAERLGVTKYEWACHRDNQTAIRFYDERVGAHRIDEYVTYELDVLPAKEDEDKD